MTEVAAPPAPDEHQLVEVSARQPLGAYLRDGWRLREFTRTFSVVEMRAENMDTVLGNVWHLLNPALLIAIYYFVFVVLVNVNRGVDNPLTFLAIGVFVFQWSQKSIISGAKSLVGNRGLMESVYFPRALLPLASTLGQTTAYIPSVGVMFLVALLTGQRPGWPWFLVPVIVVCQALYNFGASLVTARMTAAYRDVQNILPFVFRLLFYVSGILFPLERYIKNVTLQHLAAINPLYCFVSLMRSAVLIEAPNPAWIISVLAWTVVLVLAGFLFFRANEHNYGHV